MVATNLQLPMPDGVFDAVVSDGVIHHTPDPRRAFRENARVLKPGGHLYLGVYNRQGYYYYLYTYVGVPIRWLEKRAWGRSLVHATLLPIYYLVHLRQVPRQAHVARRRAFLLRLHHDAARIVPFEGRDRDWGRAEGLDLLDYDPAVGNVHAFVFRKRGESH